MWPVASKWSAFPVCAGVSPFADDLHEAIEHVPRIRGDEPQARPFREGNGQCSLRERG